MTQTMDLLGTLLSMAKEFGLLDIGMKQELRKTDDMLTTVMSSSATLPPNETDWDTLISSFIGAQRDSNFMTTGSGRFTGSGMSTGSGRFTGSGMGTGSGMSTGRGMTTGGSGYPNGIYDSPPSLDTTDDDFLGANPNVIVRPDMTGDMMSFIPFPSWDDENNDIVEPRNANQEATNNTNISQDQLSTLITSLNDLRETIQKKELSPTQAPVPLPPDNGISKSTLLELIQLIRKSEENNAVSLETTTLDPMTTTVTEMTTTLNPVLSETTTLPESNELEEPIVAQTQYFIRLPIGRGIVLTVTFAQGTDDDTFDVTLTHRDTTFSPPYSLMSNFYLE